MASNGGSRAPNLVQLSTVQAQHVDFLDPRIPLGKATVLAGPSGMGKSMATMSMAANITVGRPILPIQVSPEATTKPPANVLLMAGEDGAADTIRPRIEASDGNPDRVYILDGFFQEVDGQLREFAYDLQQVDILEQALENIKPALTILDPIQLYLGAGIDMHKANEVRSVTREITRLAEVHQTAFIVVAHLNKGNGHSGALNRVMGSVDFVALARSVLIFGEIDGQLALAHAKANLTAKAPTLTYTIENGALYWTGTIGATADELTSPNAPGSGNARQDAKDFLLEHLSDGPIPADEILNLAKRTGISPGTLKRAKAELGIDSHRIGKPGGSGTWVWSAPTTQMRPLTP